MMIPRRISSSLRCAASHQHSQFISPRIAQQAFAPSRQALASASPRLAVRRWYSEAPAQEAKKAEEGSATPEENKTGETAKEESPLQKELEEEKKKNIDLTDRLKRSIADFRNLQEQTKREVAAGREFALQRWAKDLLDSIDNLDRALTSLPKDALENKEDALKNLQSLHGGLKMTDSIMMQTLKKHGLERLDPSENGDKFDPNRHEAVTQMPMQGKEDGTCFFTQQKGFVYNGRTLRAAKVGVVKNS